MSMPTPTPAHSRVRRVARMVKTVELLVAVAALLSWPLLRYCPSSSSFTSTIADHAAAAVQYASEFLLRTAPSPHFVFLVGNAIILTLLLHSSAASAGNRKISIEAGEFDSDRSSGEEHIAAGPAREEEVMAPTSAGDIMRRLAAERKRFRTRSVGLEVEMTMRMDRAELRRSETKPRRNTGRGGEVEDLSSEEFKRKVEAFIARQQRFLREESLSTTTTAASAAAAAVFVK